MTQVPFDQLAKEFLQELLTPLGRVERSFEVPGEPKFIDVWFQPAIIPNVGSENLTLLERISATPCAFEPFRNPPSRNEIRRCLSKLLWVLESELRLDDTTPEEQLPVLWILASSVSKPVIQEGKGTVSEDWIPGIYFCGNLFKTVLVAIDELPETDETLWMRVLGRDETQERAIAEVLALPAESPERSRILQMLTNWRVRIDLLEPLDSEDERLRMALSQAYLAWEQTTEQRGELRAKQDSIRSLLRVRFGDEDETILAITPQLLNLSTDDYTRLILQSSREEILRQFSPSEI
jgi:hypothetical protein